MSVFYDQMAATALELITEFGIAGTLYRTPDNGVMTGAGDRVPAPIESAVVGIKVGQEVTLVEGTEQLATKNLLAALLLAPEPGDRLSLAGSEGLVLKVDTKAPDGTTLLHEVWT